MTTLWRRRRNLWRVWTRLARQIGNFYARVLLTLLYAVAILPFGLAVHFLADPLRIKKRPSGWIERPQEPNDLKWARRQ